MKVLVAEDDFIARSLLKNMLETSGHEVLVAEDGEAAWRLIQQYDIRMVITDWMMPKMDGLTLCRTIRENASTGYVFIIILTAKNTKDDIISGLDAGADDYLSKPFNHAELVARLKTGRRILDLEKSLQNANEKIRALSITDSLTGCYNKRYLDEHFPGEIKRAKRYGHPLSIIMSDIDYFKKINDAHGHLTGDQVLIGFANRIQRSIREGVDWIVRYGGEEFLIVLPHTDISKACLLTERLRTEICLRPFSAGDKEFHVFASFGVTGFDSKTPENLVAQDVLIHQADTYLYQSKQEGRNRVTGGAMVHG